MFGCIYLIDKGMVADGGVWGPKMGINVVGGVQELSAALIGIVSQLTTEWGY